MSSTYKRRLNLLTFGYSRLHSISDEIMQLILLWVKSRPYLDFEQICNSPRFQMEISLDQFSYKLLSFDHSKNKNLINQYEVKYIPYKTNESNQNQQTMKQFIDKNKLFVNRVNTFNVFHETNYLSFIEIDNIGNENGNDYLIKIIAKDKDLNIFCESKWCLLKIGYPFLRIANHDSSKHVYGEYFEENIDLQFNEFVNIKQWLIFCKNQEIELSIIDQKRAFHFMEYLSLKRQIKEGNDNGEDIKEQGVEMEDFVNFLCNDYYNMYSDKFKILIDKFKDKIAESPSDIDDDYIFVFT